MFDVRWICENPDLFNAGLAKRGGDPIADQIIALDNERREIVSRLQEGQTRRNAASKEIGKAMGQGDQDLAEKLKAEVSALKESLQADEEAEREVSKKLQTLVAAIPNLPLDDVPQGEDEDDNVLLHTHGEKPSFDFEPKEHFELGDELGQMDFERAAKLSGSRFVVLSGELARLERALGQFMLDTHTRDNGYTEVSPPLLVRDDAMFGTGQLPKFAEDLFIGADIPGRTKLSTQSLEEKTTPDDLAELVEITDAVELAQLVEDIQERADTHEQFWMIPTAEVPLTNLVREEIQEAGVLPLRFTALTPCFRSEAGSAGRDTKGMLRQHQFSKVELVSITDQESSLEELERMRESAETILKKLGIHYRVVTLCTGDMGFSARKTYDIEAWLPGQNAYREISSCSVCGDFQARRMNARYRTGEGKQVNFVHTLNGSGVAVGRALIAVLENYQNADGSITVPDCLRPYMAGQELIGKG